MYKGVQYILRFIETLPSKKMGESSEHPVKLHDGYYKVSGHRAQFMRINGNTATLKDVHETFVFLTTITYGVYGRQLFILHKTIICFTFQGEAHFKIKEKVNKYCKNNVMFTAPENKGKETEMLYQLPIEYGVISEDGKKCYVEGQKIYQFERISDEEYKALDNDFDPIEAPPGPYTIQQRQGKLKKNTSYRLFSVI